MHFGPLTVDGGEFIDGLEFFLSRFVKDDIRIFNLIIGLVEKCKLYPDFGGFTNCFGPIDRPQRFSVSG